MTKSSAHGCAVRAARWAATGALLLALAWAGPAAGKPSSNNWIVVAYDEVITSPGFKEIIEPGLTNAKKGLEFKYLPYKRGQGLAKFFQTNTFEPGLIIGPTESASLADLNNRVDENERPGTVFIYPGITTDVKEYSKLNALQATPTDEVRVRFVAEKLPDHLPVKNLIVVHEDDVWGQKVKEAVHKIYPEGVKSDSSLNTRLDAILDSNKVSLKSIIKGAAEANAHFLFVALSDTRAVNQLFSTLREFNGKNFVKYRPLVVLLSQHPINRNDRSLLATNVDAAEAVMVCDLAGTNVFPRTMTDALMPDLATVLRLIYSYAPNSADALNHLTNFYRGAFASLPEALQDKFTADNVQFHSSYHKYLKDEAAQEQLAIFLLKTNNQSLFPEIYSAAPAANGTSALARRIAADFSARNQAFANGYLHAAVFFLAYLVSAFTVSGKTVVRFRRFWYHWRFLLLTGLSLLLAYGTWIGVVWHEPGFGRAYLVPLSIAALAPSLLSAADRMFQRFNLPINVAFIAQSLNDITKGLIAEINKTEQGLRVSNAIRANPTANLELAARQLLVASDISDSTANKFNLWLKESLKRAEKFSADRTLSKIYADFIAQMMIYKHGFQWDKIEEELVGVGVAMTLPTITVVPEPETPPAEPVFPEETPPGDGDEPTAHQA
jgi:hypothetical protein